MISFDLKNIQAIADAHIQFEDNSIVGFTGNNSNGKSIIAKVIEALTKGELQDRDTRQSLIRDGTGQGVFIMTRNKCQLGLILTEEIKDSWIMFWENMDTNDKILRPLGDKKAVEILSHKFGFRTYQKGDVCLQLSPTFGAIPFVTTSGSTNDEIVKDITRDRIADEFLSAFSTITFPAFKNTISNLKQKRSNMAMALENMESYDWRFYNDIALRMQEVYKVINVCKFYGIEEIPIPPADVIPVKSLVLQEIPLVEFYDDAPTIKEINNELDDYIQLLNGICPTCGRSLIE